MIGHKKTLDYAPCIKCKKVMVSVVYKKHDWQRLCVDCRGKKLHVE